MADEIAPVDVFKFLALRPAQRVADQGAAVGVIRDPRAGSEDGRKSIALGVRRALAKEAAPPDQARIRALSDMRAKALQTLEDGAGGDVVTLLSGVHAVKGDTAHEVWDSVYAAYRAGPGGGPALEEPLAALRFLHAAQLVASGDVKDAAGLKDALTATPLIPPLPEVLPEAPAQPETKEESPAEAPAGEGRGRGLLADMAATESLLTSLAAAKPTTADIRTRTDLDAGGGLKRAESLIRNIPKFAAAAAAPTAAETSVIRQLNLGEHSSVPQATRALQGHLQNLTRQALALQGDAGFRALARSSEVRALKRVIPPSAEIGPGWKSIFDNLLSSADADVRGRIKPLGIGDLKVVKQTLLRYVPGEVAHIENVLKGESKSRKHRVLDRSETLFTEKQEDSEETQRDTQTTDRFELKREAEKTIKEDMSITAGLTVTGSYGPVQITAQGNFAYATSQQESQKSSANFAREVVDRSVSKIQKKTSTERTTKTLHEVEEINDHGLDNVVGAAHITGVYRWVDKRYRAQVYNYGARLMIEFVVPDPAAFFRFAQQQAGLAAVDITPPLPLVDSDGTPLTPDDLDASNYQIFVGRYNVAGVSPPPPDYTYIGAAFEQNGMNDGQTFSKSLKDIAIPDGYIWDHYEIEASAIYGNYPQFSIQVAGQQHKLLNDGRARQMAVGGFGTYWGGSTEDDPRGIVPVSAVGYDLNAYTVHVGVTCRLTEEGRAKWQLQTFEKIATAYQALQTAYEQKLAQIKANRGAVMIEGRNPGQNREIEKTELKRLCLTLLTGKHFNGPGLVAYPAKPGQFPELDVLKTLARGGDIQFFEQAFDWEQLTYLFYPYFWARKERWLELCGQSDPDPLFTQFLQAGAARVVVPVPLAYKDAVLYLLETGLVWQGGETPRLDDPLFVSIAEELRNRTDDLAGATPEGDPWEFTLPTTLVWLQPGPELPVLNA